MTPIELAAKALYERGSLTPEVPWEAANDKLRDAYMGSARTAINTVVAAVEAQYLFVAELQRLFDQELP